MCFYAFQIYWCAVSLTPHHNIQHFSDEIQESKHSPACTAYLVVMWLPEQQGSWRTRLEPAAAGLLCVKACRSVALCPATTPENSSVRVSSGDAVEAIYSHLLTTPLNGYLIKCVCWECKSRDAHSCGSTFWINLAQTLKLNQRNCSWFVIYEKRSRKDCVVHWFCSSGTASSGS